MTRTELLTSLTSYYSQFPEERAFIPRFKSLIVNFPNCFQRSLISGHMTASSWIIDATGTVALLVHHKNLNRWLQPGGHADGEENILKVSFKEAEEETGLKSLKLIRSEIFDIDIHLIPKHNDVQSHYHFDIRYLFSADINEIHSNGEQSYKIQWVPLSEVKKITESNPSIVRMVLKTKSIFNSKS